MEPTRKPILNLVAAAASGLLLWCAFAPVEQFWTAWAGMLLLLLALRPLGPFAATLAGFLAGLAFFGPLLWWLARFGIVAWLPLVMLESLFFAAFGLVVARSRRLGAVPRIAGIALAWATLEILRARIPLGGFEWGVLGYSQLDTALAAAARLAGVHAVGALIVATTATVIEAVDRRVRRTTAAVVALVVLLGPALLPLGAASPARETLDVVAVQGNVPRGHFSTLGRTGGRTGPEDLVIIDNHIDVTERLLQEEQKPRLVVWPENAIDRDPLRIPVEFERIKALVRSLGTSLIAGSILEDGDHFTNSNLFLDPTGEVAGRYDKLHLVPFGEYVPIPVTRRFIPLLDQEIPIDGRPGERPVLFDVDGVRVGSVICFESTYGALVRDFARRGAQVIVVTTNDASFGDGPAARQHMTMSRMRAVETGRAVVHAAIAGESAMILPDGTVIDRAGLFVPALLRARLPVATGQTPFTRYGGVVELLFVIGAAVALGLTFRKGSGPSASA